MKKQAALSIILVLVGLFLSLQAWAQAPVKLHWLQEQTLTEPTGVSWGVPWPRGTVKKGQAFELTSEDGPALPLQSWPLAYWPDGSLKWVGFATVAETNQKNFSLRPTTNTKAPEAGIVVEESKGAIKINTGKLKCLIPKSGSVFLDSLQVENRVVGSQGHLECVLQKGPDGEVYEVPEREKYISSIKKVVLEQKGPVRAVVRVEGMLQSAEGERSLLPFTVRMYFYADSKAVRMVHTIIYDGDQQKDFIRGLGVVFFCSHAGRNAQPPRAFCR